MASIVEFKREGILARPSVRPPCGSAEIVFFPGVRYERAPEPSSDKPQRRRTRRDRLDFDD